MKQEKYWSLPVGLNHLGQILDESKIVKAPFFYIDMNGNKCTVSENEKNIKYLVEKGIKPVLFINRDFDIEFYTIDEDNTIEKHEDYQITIEYSIVEKMTIEEVRERIEKKINYLAYRLLFPTDFYITRKSEKNIYVPGPISDERDNIRLSVTDTVNNINNIEIYKDLVEYDWESVFVTNCTLEKVNEAKNLNIFRDMNRDL